MKKFGIKAKHKSQYRYELLKAIWTYRLRDETYARRLSEVANINTSLLELAKYQPLSEFKKDPIKMTKEEFTRYYEKLKADYQPKIVLKFQDQNFEEDAEDEKKADSVGSVIEENESNASIDRKLRAESRRKAKQGKGSVPDEEKVGKEVSSMEKVNDEPDKSKEESNESHGEINVSSGNDSEPKLLKESDDGDKSKEYEAAAQEHLDELYKSADAKKE